jgi:glycosyltransferase involved in cell wall biosynthesis
MPKVSIIVPTYNAQQWLETCVNSVICQSFTDWQLILVDDGSTDSSSQICDKFASLDSRISAIHKKNGGLSSARNYGIKHAIGDFIFFIDADDAIHNQTLEFLCSMQSKTNADICIGGAIYATSHNFGKLDFNNQQTYLYDEIIAKILYQCPGFINSACNTLFKRELFNNLSFSEGTWYEDLDFFYKIYHRASKISHSKQITYLYRANPNSYMNTWSHERLDVLCVVDNMVEYMAKNETTELQRAAADRRFSAYYNMFALGATHGEHDICDRCWHVIKELRGSELCNKKVRLKNKLGALLSYLGKPVTIAVAKIILR